MRMNLPMKQNLETNKRKDFRNMENIIVSVKDVECINELVKVLKENYSNVKTRTHNNVLFHIDLSESKKKTKKRKSKKIEKSEKDHIDPDWTKFQISQDVLDEIYYQNHQLHHNSINLLR